MTQGERQILEEVREEHGALRDSGIEQLKRRPKEPGLERALERLEVTFLLRAYSAFESILNARLSLGASDGSTLGNKLQRIAREDASQDPATQSNLPWRKLLTRDRNLIMHGRISPPAWPLNITLAQMEVFLSQYP